MAHSLTTLGSPLHNRQLLFQPLPFPSRTYSRFFIHIRRFFFFGTAFLLSIREEIAYSSFQFILRPPLHVYLSRQKLFSSGLPINTFLIFNYNLIITFERSPIKANLLHCIRSGQGCQKTIYWLIIYIYFLFCRYTFTLYY